MTAAVREKVVEQTFSSSNSEPQFKNPFQLDDIAVFDDATLREMLDGGAFGLNTQDLALSLHGMASPLLNRIRHNLSPAERKKFQQAFLRPVSVNEVKAARQRILDSLFWELTYWKTPELYEELTEGEKIHPGIFRRLQPDLQGRVVLDAGAGSGRASFECLQQGARQVYAVEPSPGLLQIMQRKIADQPAPQVVPLQGRFDKLPLDDNSVDIAISCSAFTAEQEQGGDPGLAELKRVTKPGGKIVIIWPRTVDHSWLDEQGFKYVALPLAREMTVKFRSLTSAVRIARRFYAKNQALLNYLRTRRQPEVPFSILDMNPPRDYCWLEVKK